MVKKTPEIIETLLPGRPVVGSIGFTRIDSHQRFNQVPRRATSAELQKEWEELLDPFVVSLVFSKTSEKQRHKRIFFFELL